MKMAVIRRLTHGLAANWLMPVAPSKAARPRPRPVNVKTIPSEYTSACLIPSDLRASAFLVKYDTVIGIMGNTHGVAREIAPMVIASQRNGKNPLERAS